jgi:membrane-associated phospholipid phosphatase
MDLIQDFDVYIFKLIHCSFKNELFDILMPIVRNKLTWIPLYLVLIYFLKKNYIKNYWKIIILAICSVVISDLVCAKILKEIFQRMRPCHFLVLETWFSDFNLCSSTYSFPSCHAMNHATIAAMLFPYFKDKAFKIGLVFWVLLIGYAQIYIGVHYPTDIIGGIVIGFVFSFGFRKITSLFLKI